MAEAIVEEQDETAAAVDEDGAPFEYDGPEGTRPEGEAEQELEGNGRRTLADLAAEAPEPDAEPEEPQARLFGTETKITASVKGPRPTTSHVKFKAAQIEVTGQFQPDDLIELRSVVRLDKVELNYKRDAAGTIKAVKRVHFVSAVTVEQINLPVEVQRARLEHAASALGVDPDELAGALERAAAEVGSE